MAKVTPHKALYLRIAPELHEQLVKLAAADKRSVNALAEVILERYAAEYARQCLLTIESGSKVAKLSTSS